MIDLSPDHLKTVRQILAEHVPACEVRAFGSRATLSAKDYSDLDLAVVGVTALDRGTLARLKEAFEESDLPIRVDVLDWQGISESFQEVIARDYAVLHKMPDGPGNQRYSSILFVRQTPYACAGFAFVFDEVYEFEAGETITQRYRLVIANGAGMRRRSGVWLGRGGVGEGGGRGGMRSCPGEVRRSCFSHFVAKHWGPP